MDFTYLQPVNSNILEDIASFKTERLGNNVRFYTKDTDRKSVV